LAIELSKLIQHPQNSVELEQYPTEGDLAAFFMLAVDQLDELHAKTIVDIGAGNGILGIGCAILDASKVILIEGDEDVSKIASENAEKVMNNSTCEIQVMTCMLGIQESPKLEDVDIVVMNPPWGFQTPKADRPMLEYAFSLNASAIYVLHSAKAKHLVKMAKDCGYDSEIVFESNFRLPAKYSHQSRRMSNTQVRCWRFHKPGDAKILLEEE